MSWSHSTSRLRLLVGATLLVLGAGVVGALIGMASPWLVRYAVVVMPIAWAVWVWLTLAPRVLLRQRVLRRLRPDGTGTQLA